MCSPSLVYRQNWKEMNHDWQTGCDRTLSSAPFRLLAWLLFGAFLNETASDSLHVMIIMIPSSVTSLPDAIVAVAGDVGLALYTRYWLNEEVHTSYAAHFAGALVGEYIVKLIGQYQIGAKGDRFAMIKTHSHV